LVIKFSLRNAIGLLSFMSFNWFYFSLVITSTVVLLMCVIKFVSSLVLISVTSVKIALVSILSNLTNGYFLICELKLTLDYQLIQI
jgi:hypothetical protein